MSIPTRFMQTPFDEAAFEAASAKLRALRRTDEADDDLPEEPSTATAVFIGKPGEGKPSRVQPKR